MRKLPVPNIKPAQSFSDCIASIQSANVRREFNLRHQELVDLADEYVEYAQRAELGDLVGLPDRAPKTTQVLGAITKGQLMKLYDQQFRTNPAGRALYQKLLYSTGGYCPFCGGIGESGALDHFLPKANFPAYSVVAANLVPSCSKCNSEGKATSVPANNSDVPIHPYFDDDCFFEEHWIVGQVVRSGSRFIIEFNCSPPDHWTAIQKARAHTHFVLLNLSLRYGCQGATELAHLIDQRKSHLPHLSSIDFKSLLASTANSRVFEPNHWRRVTYLALSENVEFCEEDF